MCIDPATFATATALAATARRTFDTYVERRDQARVADRAAAHAESRAAQRLQAAEAQADALRRKGAALAGRRRAGFGHAGVTLEGSPADVLAQDAEDAALDALTARHSGVIDANADLFEAAETRRRALLARRAARRGVLEAVIGPLGQWAGRPSAPRRPAPEAP